MAGPPDSIEPSELWRALTQLPRPHKLVDLPRCLPGTNTPVGQVAIWPISQSEQMAANAEADRFTKALLKDPQRKDDANLGYTHTYSNEVAIQVLYRVCRDAQELKRPAFPSPSQMRETFTADEVGVLFNSYLVVQNELGPIVAELTTEEMEGWIKRLAAGGSSYPFFTLSLECQSALVTFLVSRLSTLSMGITSPGAQPDDQLEKLTADSE